MFDFVSKPWNWCKMFSTLVDAGNAKSTTEDVSMSSNFFLFLVISGSEQIHIALIGSKASAYHSLSVCPNNAIDGTKKSIKPFPLVSFSAIRNELKVLPVPQAIMSLPLSWFLKWLFVFVSASV